MPNRNRPRVAIAVGLLLLLVVGLRGVLIQDRAPGDPQHVVSERPPLGVSAQATGATSTGLTRQSDSRRPPPHFTTPRQEQYYPRFGKPRGAATPFDLAFFNTIPKIKRCYLDVLERRPDVTGKFIIRFTIARDGDMGRVREATILPPESGDTELSEPLMQQCILLALQESPFPAPSGESEEHTMPLTFGGLTPPERARRGLPPRAPNDTGN
jgi:hypothetical protein